MIFQFHRVFEKQFAKLPEKKRAAVKEAIRCFAADRREPSLRFHALSGRFAGQSSISAGGDLRIHLKELDDGTVVVVMAVGSHSQLYG
jgi:mRNA-degrading endonuclease YafQ of YafQ-DinJ toxin-antitoxin module